MTDIQRMAYARAAATYGVPIPDYLATAQAFHAAATAYRVGVETAVQPTLAGITAANIAATVDAILAAGQHDDRLALATRVETIGYGLLGDAYMRFKEVLMIELAAPFDKAAQKFMTVYDRDPNAPQDPATVATLEDLVRLRDMLAGRVGASTPTGDVYDLPSRCTTAPNRDALTGHMTSRTHLLGRGSLEWLNAMLAIPGVRLKWQTPAQQVAHIAALPQHATA